MSGLTSGSASIEKDFFPGDVGSSYEKECWLDRVAPILEAAAGLPMVPPPPVRRPAPGPVVPAMEGGSPESGWEGFHPDCRNTKLSLHPAAADFSGDCVTTLSLDTVLVRPVYDPANA